MGAERKYREELVARERKKQDALEAHKNAANLYRGCRQLKVFLFPEELDQERREQDWKRQLAELSQGWDGTTQAYWQKAKEMGLLDPEELRRHKADGSTLKDERGAGASKRSESTHTHKLFPFRRRPLRTSDGGT